MRDEPHGEERDDLRIGALASVLWNCNIDTKENGVIEPRDYISGWNSERVGLFMLKPKELRETEAQGASGNGNGGGGGQLDLNDPIGWENFATGLIKVVGGRPPQRKG